MASAVSPFVCQEIFTNPVANATSNEGESGTLVNSTTTPTGPTCLRFSTLPQCIKIGKDRNLYFLCVAQDTISVGGYGPKPLPNPVDFPMTAFLCNTTSCPTESSDDVAAGAGGHKKNNGSSTDTGTANAVEGKVQRCSVKQTLLAMALLALLIPEILFM